MDVLENYYIQFFKHNNMLVNERTQKERNEPFELNHYLQLTTHAPYAIPSTWLTSIYSVSRRYA